MRQIGIWFGCYVLCLTLGCSKEQKTFTKETIKVSGIITVNGEAPATPIQLECKSEQIPDPEHPTASTATTAPDGSFEISTYVPGDGVPEGKYALVATWTETNVMLSNATSSDKLGGKYDAINESPKQFEVTAGDEPIDLGTIDLKAAVKKK